MILILVRFMQIGRARESWQINHKARFMDLPALACTSNLHEPHQNKNHSLNGHYTKTRISNYKVKVNIYKIIKLNCGWIKLFSTLEVLFKLNVWFWYGCLISHVIKLYHTHYSYGYTWLYNGKLLSVSELHSRVRGQELQPMFPSRWCQSWLH